jgi:D-amino-acid oxidase
MKRVKHLVPELKLEDNLIQEVQCGLRPVRPELRLEAELSHACGVPVVHSYGHGGSGWTVFKGVARETAHLVEQTIHDMETSG